MTALDLEARLSRVTAVKRVVGRNLCIFLLVVSGAFVVTACDPGHNVTYENTTDQVVSVFVNGAFDFTLGPSEKKEFLVFKFREETLEAKDEVGRVIYSETFTWEELKEAGWQIVITQSISDNDSRAPAGTPSPLPTDE